MFNRIFGKPKQYALTTIDTLSETLEMIEKKERVLLKKASSEYEKAKEFLKKASSEVEKAKEFTREKNKKAAIQCLERKRLYEQQVDQLRNFQLSIPDQTLEMLKKKEKDLLKKASVAFEKAKEFTRTKNEKAAIQCLKRKRLYIQQVEKLRNFQLRIHDQMIMLEGAKATTETVDALRTGAAAMKAMRKAMNIDDVDKTMDEINEQTENMKQNNFFNLKLQLLHLCMCQLANNLFHLRYGLLKKMKWHFEKVDEIILQV